MTQKLLDANRRWSLEKRHQCPDYFEKLSQLQEPEYLWIGCSDSRVPANVITGLDPGEVFVHRNVANLVHPTDLNMLSVVEYAVLQLGVRHIIVCGHYGCGGVRAAVSGSRFGSIDHWLQPIRDVADREYRCNEAEWCNEDQLDRLCELSVIEQVNRLSRTPILQDAWGEGKDVSVHGWIYGLKDGLLHDLDCTIGPANNNLSNPT
ncbi:carbonic anhydrase [Rhizobium leguminosarum]|uniref:carbonic anhydrase n=1 Tax=Rhizobium leguminosarum TaxID=384 RepID=UPI001C97AFBA|nr:carbonic anhydrase [Rhizobium leguminosarum]MBY5377267.1 carbonic anhydrase [Rhizobium leguminosarum]